MFPHEPPRRLAPRDREANKTTVGRVLVVGGSRELSGAVLLTARGALRAGAGLVKVAVPEGIQQRIATALPEVTTIGLRETPAGGLAYGSEDALAQLADAWDVVVIGPGAGRDEATGRLIRAVLARITGPVLLDADGLHALREQREALEERAGLTLLTPHEGEAARLLGISSDAVHADRESTARTLAAADGVYCILKGPGTLITDGTRILRDNMGTPILATGGSGDVLAGVVGAMVAQAESDDEILELAALGVWCHGAAGRLAAGSRDRGVFASEIADAVPDAMVHVMGGEAS